MLSFFKSKSTIQNHKKTFIFLTIVVLLIAFRLYLPILALNYINKELNKDPNYEGSISEVDLHLWRGAYTMHDLKIERVEGQKIFPFITADRIFIGLSWRDLFKRTVVAQVSIERPVLNLVAEKAAATPEEKEKHQTKKKVVIGGETKAEKKQEVHTWHEVFKNLVPLDISRLRAWNGSLHFRDITSNPKVDVYLDKLHVIGENLTNSSKLSKSLFGQINIGARAMKSGELDVKILINPTADPLQAKVTLKLVNLALTNLNDLFKAYGKFDIKEGSFDLFSEIAVADNNIKGYVKPLIRKLEVSDFKQDLKKGLGHAIWEKVIGAVGFLLKNHGKDQQGIEVPFEGRIDKPGVKVWDSIVSVFQNIFIQALPRDVDHTIKLEDVKK